MAAENILSALKVEDIQAVLKVLCNSFCIISSASTFLSLTTTRQQLGQTLNDQLALGSHNHFNELKMHTLNFLEQARDLEARALQLKVDSVNAGKGDLGRESPFSRPQAASLFEVQELVMRLQENSVNVNIPALLADDHVQYAVLVYSKSHNSRVRFELDARMEYLKGCTSLWWEFAQEYLNPFEGCSEASSMQMILCGSSRRFCFVEGPGVLIVSAKSGFGVTLSHRCDTLIDSNFPIFLDICHIRGAEACEIEPLWCFRVPHKLSKWLRRHTISVVHMLTWFSNALITFWLELYTHI